MRVLPHWHASRSCSTLHVHHVRANIRVNIHNEEHNRAHKRPLAVCRGVDFVFATRRRRCQIGRCEPHSNFLAGHFMCPDVTQACLGRGKEAQLGVLKVLTAVALNGFAERPGMLPFIATAFLCPGRLCGRGGAWVIHPVACAKLAVAVAGSDGERRGQRPV